MSGEEQYAPADLPERISAFLLDCEAPHDLTTPLLALVENDQPGAKLALVGALHQILASTFTLDEATRPSPQQLASFLHSSLFTPIEQTEAEADVKLERKAVVADALLDVAWQLDQQVDVLVPLAWDRQNSTTAAEAKPEQAAPALQDGDAKMDVDETPPSTAPDRKIQSDNAVEQARQRLGSLLRLLVDSSDVPKGAVLERLDVPLISTTGLLLDARTFMTVEVRTRTALYYRQQKFNLLREESEGYSKLIVELLANLGPPHSPLTAEPQEEAAERAHRAESVNDKMKTLIGNFDLDPSRTLDVLLDAFSDNAVHHWQFFIDVLAASPWAPNNRPGAERSTNGGDAAKGKQPALDVSIEREEGSDIIAQILGFKFAFHRRPGSPDVLKGLYTTAALLIWHGLVKLTDLWPHLSPTDEELVKLEGKWRDEQAQLARSVGGANALAMAGALADDEAPAAGTASSSSTSAPATKASTSTAPTPAAAPTPNQKVGLLRSLLSIGDITHSFFILSQYPFLVGAFPDIADLLNRLASCSIAPAFEVVSISSRAPTHAAGFSATRSRVTVDSKGEKKVTPLAQTFALTADAFPNPRHDWTFFFPRWQERVPRASDFARAVSLLEEMYLPLVKVLIARQPSLLSKLLRMAAADLGTNPGDHPRRTNWLDLLRSYLVPAISMLEHYPAAALELWRVLSLFPIETRFQIYGEWKDVHYRRDPALAIRKAEAERDVKALLRRLSKDNVKKLGKTFARIAHTNPTVIFGIALHQVQSYDNLIVPVVEACRYLTDLGYDVMAYSILDALSSSRPKTKEDGTSIAMWLQGLATFTGQVYRRWISMQPSLWVILQYLVNQLVSGNSKDLVVLREIISRMTAIEPFADLSDAQVASLAGGKCLRSEVFQKTELDKMAQRGQQDGLVKARLRLAASLLGRGLAIPMLVNIALQRQACLKTDAHLKSLGALFDQNHAILFQYTELLQAISEPEQLAELVPPVEDLLDRYKLDAGIAFDIARPRLRASLRAHDEKEAADLASSRKKQGLLAKLAKEKEKVAAAAADNGSAATAFEEASGDVKMEDVKAGTESGTPPPPDVDDKVLAEDSDVIVVDADDAPPVSPAPTSTGPWHPGLASAISRVEALLPAEARSTVGAGFFVTFWQLTLYDIMYPKDRYDAEINRLKLLQREASLAPVAKADDRRFFIDSVMSIASGLVEEASKHLNARSTVNRRLNREKAHWFADVKTKPDRLKLAEDMLQYCVQPRARMSLPDATFAYQMVKRLHAINTPHFHTVVFFDRLLSSQISPVLYSCTENEARNYGLFLHDVLADLFRWYKDKSLYESEAIGAQLVGFRRNQAETDKTKSHYDHKAYRAALEKWHGHMVQGFAESFASAEYMHIKNSILVLTKVAPFFPLDYSHGTKLERSVSGLLAIEKREDLKILAQGYKAVLMKRKKDWVNRPAAATEATSARPSPAPTAIKEPSALKSASPQVTPAPSLPTKPEGESTTGASSAAAPAHNARNSLPVKPSSRLPEDGATGNVPSRPEPERTRSETESTPRSGMSLAERLKKEALASKRTPLSTETQMETPSAPAPARSTSTRVDRNEPAPRSAGPSRASSPRRHDSDREHRSRDSGSAREHRSRDSGSAREHTPREASESRTDAHDRRGERDGGEKKDDRYAADNRAYRDSKHALDSRDARSSRYPDKDRDLRDAKDSNAARDVKSSGDSRDPRNGRDDRYGRVDSHSRSGRDVEPPREPAGSTAASSTRDRDAPTQRETDRARQRSVESSHSSRASASEARDGRDSRDNRSANDSRGAGDSRNSRSNRDDRDHPSARDIRDDRNGSRRDDKRSDRDAKAASPERSRSSRDARPERSRDDQREDRASSDRARRSDAKESRHASDDRRSSARDAKDSRRDDERERRSSERSKRDEPAPSSRPESEKPEASVSSTRRNRDADRFAKTPTPATTASTDESRHSRRDRRLSDRKMTREEEIREAEKEKQRERDRQREAEREEAREKERQRDAEREAAREAAREKEHREARSRRFNQPPAETAAPAARNGLPPKPSLAAGGGGGGDRLRPAPARAQERSPAASAPDVATPSLLERARASLPGVAAPSSPASSAPARNEDTKKDEPAAAAATEEFSIKGRGRLFQGLTSGSMGGSRRDEDSSKKRLADRLGPEDPKRPRTEEPNSRERRSRR